MLVEGSPGEFNLFAAEFSPFELTGGFDFGVIEGLPITRRNKRVACRSSEGRQETDTEVDTTGGNTTQT